MPRSCSMLIQSEVAWGPFLPFTLPATAIARPRSSSFSVIVVLPASGCEMMAKVRRRAIAPAMLASVMGFPSKSAATAISPAPRARIIADSCSVPGVRWWSADTSQVLAARSRRAFVPWRLRSPSWRPGPALAGQLEELPPVSPTRRARIGPSMEWSARLENFSSGVDRLPREGARRRYPSWGRRRRAAPASR